MSTVLYEMPFQNSIYFVADKYDKANIFLRQGVFLQNNYINVCDTLDLSRQVRSGTF